MKGYSTGTIPSIMPDMKARYRAIWETFPMSNSPPRVSALGEGETLAKNAHEESKFAQSFRRADVEIAFARSETPVAEVFATDELALRVVYQGVGTKPKTKVCKE